MTNKCGAEGAKKYMFAMRNSIGDKLINPDSIYYGKKGHLRLARECGYALLNFNEAGQKEILSSSYGIIYVSGCKLEPLLSAALWYSFMRQGAGMEC